MRLFQMLGLGLLGVGAFAQTNLPMPDNEEFSISA